MRLVLKKPEMFHVLLASLFFFGALSLSSIFHDENKILIRVAIQIIIFSTAIILIISSGLRSVMQMLWGAPIAGLLSLATNSQYPLHLFLLTLICLILIRRSEYREYDSWPYACWVGCFTGLILDIILGKLGIAESKIYYVVTSGTEKNSIGFFNPNIAALLSVSAVIFSSLAKKRLFWIISLAVYAYVLSETYARTSIAFLAIYYFNIAFMYKMPSIFKRVASITLCAISILVVVALIFMESGSTFANSEQFEDLDRIFSHRLSLALPSLGSVGLLLPGEAPRNMDLAIANIIIVFGGLPLIAFLLLSMFIATRISANSINFYFMCLMISFASLFSENIAYIYMPIGLIFAVPFACAVHFLSESARTSLHGQNK